MEEPLGIVFLPLPVFLPTPKEKKKKRDSGTPLPLSLKLVGSAGHWWIDFEREEEWFNAEPVIRFA